MVAQAYAPLFGPPHFFILGLEEIIGPEELGHLIEHLPELKQIKGEVSPEHIPPVRKVMAETYGKTGARGIAMCAGRASFPHLLKRQANQLGFESSSFRFLPGRSKLKQGLSLLANWMEKTYHEQIKIVDIDQQWSFQVSSCSECAEFLASESMCDFTAGLLQGFMTWAGGGKFYRIVETRCRSKGDEYCDFLIDKNPVD